MKKALSKAVLAIGTTALSGMLALGTGSLTVRANVPPEAEADVTQTAATPPTQPVDNNGTAQGNGSGDPLTPDGNGTEVDSVDDNGKYFYTFVTEAGNYFYIVVDETRQDKNVYVLSTVDEEELLTLCKKGESASDSEVPASEGDGTTNKSSADLFGVPGGSGGNGPSGGTDNDGDGAPDSWDLNGDGIADAWDTNGDGKPDSFDTDGDGKPDIFLTNPETVGYDVNGDGIIDAWDTNGDGIIDAYDSDGDGIPDKFGAEAAQLADAVRGASSEKSTVTKDKVMDKVKDNQSNLIFILAILAALGAGYYFKIYKPKHGPIGSGGPMEFEDDPDYEDEDEDDYGYEQESDSEEGWEREVAQDQEEQEEEVSEKEQEAEVSEQEQTEAQMEETANAGTDTEESGESTGSATSQALEEDDEAKETVEAIRRDISQQNSEADAQISQQRAKIRYLEEENNNLKEKVTRTTEILTGSVVPDEEEDEEDSEEDPTYAERASPEI